MLRLRDYSTPGAFHFSPAAILYQKRVRRLAPPEVSVVVVRLLLPSGGPTTELAHTVHPSFLETVHGHRLADHHTFQILWRAGGDLERLQYKSLRCGSEATTKKKLLVIDACLQPEKWRVVRWCENKNKTKMILRFVDTPMFHFVKVLLNGPAPAR